MRSVVLDVGNTTVKAGFFDEEGHLTAVRRAPTVAEMRAEIAAFAPARAIVASVDAPVASVATAAGLAPEQTVLFSADTPLPIRLDYATPHTLGADRVAAAVGAAYRFPAEAVLLVDAGTCLKCDWLTADGVFAGGAISPGLQLRYRALAELTGRLPLVAPGAADQMPDWPGDSTENSIRAGVEIGLLSETLAFMEWGQTRWPGVRVVFTGGDSPWLGARLGAGGHRNFVVEPLLVLHGLYRILLFSC
ncbi:MAG: type III pantothenate kinase [Hymenobacteraceae bacterium]|nr:type III pantothenate kinase [Hymenobacteraceae bacterium]